MKQENNGLNTELKEANDALKKLQSEKEKLVA